ncbi:MAG: glycosyltransferase family 39 protein, partial [Candidatus Margulisiibacteriota bacterium]
MSNRIIIFLTLATLIRLALSNLFPLTADESYYWLWSKHLDWSYVDHPPMVAYINYLTTHGIENLFTLRLGATLITLLVSIFIYFLAKETFNEKIAFWSAVLFQITPHFLIVWLTMFVELPLALFWTASLLILSRILKTLNFKLWYLLALTLGLGYLSKYTMFLFWPCFIFFLIIDPQSRVWLKRKEIYFCFFLSLIFFLPVIYWNRQHHWISFAFHSGKATADPWGVNFPLFIVDQIVHFSPFLVSSLYGAGRYSFNINRQTKLLFSFSFPIIILFLFLSLKIKVWAHWPSIGYLGTIPLVLNYLAENKKSISKLISQISVFSSLVLFILFFITPAIFLHQKEYRENYNLAKKIPKEYKVFCKTNVTASLLEFYLKRPTYLATGFLKPYSLWGEKQYEIWGIPNLKKGETIIYFGEENKNFQKYFRRAIPLP